MAVRRRRPAPKAGPAPTVRVHAIETLEVWQAALAKAEASRRVLVVQLYQAANYACSQMRGFYRRMSTDGPLKAAVFTEVEVDTAEDELLEVLGVLHGATKLPRYECYAGGQMVESYTGGVPAQVAQMIQRQVAELKASSRGSLLPKLLLAASAAAAAAGAVWWRLHHGGGGSGGGSSSSVGDLGAELRSLNERMAIAQQRLRNCEKAGKLKGAKAQRRIISQLEAQQRIVEQQLKQRDSASASGGSGGGSGASKRRGARRSSDGSGGSQPRRRKPEGDYFSFNDFEQDQRYPAGPLRLASTQTHRLVAGADGPRALSKLLASTGFVWLAAASGAGSAAAARASRAASRRGRAAQRSAHARWVLAAALLAWLGDAALLGRSEAAFLAGLGAFLLGHTAYLAAFAAAGARLAPTLVAAAALGPPVEAVRRWLWLDVPPDMQVPVALYISVISLMLAAATALAWQQAAAAGRQAPATRGAQRQQQQRRRAALVRLAGAALFLVSDVAVAADRFKGDRMANKLWGLPCYFGGQLLLASTAGAA
ncbi:Lysoplasmalogenase TMEM86A [Chlorella sorokiniana]|uniref:Lysoplasmalogenase TMEM86A n=1 Tax=Chlorella sorokiniana TaxID=3076 RepID=A0A2P6TJ09_CHLSO|nr:Lysoplasmalogenase TMEM86A [Chlorella sorokiniana]|eukprot:PRW39209.1 Lysoplasmalogenase TMEM86A [Chlorella sorokiniana]